MRAKLSYLDEQVSALAAIMTTDPSQWDPWVRRGVRYAVQTAVEAMIDTCYHVSAKRLHHAPVNAHDALDALVSGGWLPPQRVAAWHGMIGLRNRLVHGYDAISDEQLAQAVRSGIDDFRAFVDALAAR